MKGIIIYGPQGCGKTSNAVLLAEYIGLSMIIDNGKPGWEPGDPAPDDTLVLTNVPNVPGTIDFQEVKCDMEVAMGAKMARTLMAY